MLKYYLGIVGLIGGGLGLWKAWLELKTRRVKTPLSVVPPSNRKPRIVIVDDDPKDLEQCRLTLNGDYEVHTYRRPLKALADIILDCDRGEVAELILLDFMMEPIDGPGMVKIIRACQRTKQSAKTIESHKASGMERLGIKDRVELVRYALKVGWLKSEGNCRIR